VIVIVNESSFSEMLDPTLFALAAGLTVAVESSEPFKVNLVTGQVFDEVAFEVECQQIQEMVDTEPVKHRLAGMFGFNVEAMYLAGYSTRLAGVANLP
jgi:hypothetical protein